MQCRLTSLYLQENHGIAAMNHGILWAGTGDVRIILIDSKSGKLIVSTHRYYGPIRALKSNVCKSKWQQTASLPTNVKVSGNRLPQVQMCKSKWQQSTLIPTSVKVSGNRLPYRQRNVKVSGNRLPQFQHL